MNRQRLARWLQLIGIAVSLIILAIVADQFGFNLSVILAIDPIYLALAMASSAAVLVLQALRFRYVVEAFAGAGPIPVSDSMVVRMGSQFVAMTTPAYVGGEVARAAWLSSRGIPGGTALWLPYIEIIFDVFATGAVALTAGLVALFAGQGWLGGVLTAMSVAMLALMIFVVRFSRSPRFMFPPVLARLTRRVAGEKRASWLESWGSRLFGELRSASQNTLNRAHASAILWTTLYTLAITVLTGATLLLTAEGLGIHLNYLEATLAVFASILLGNLPITFGGSGLAEVGVYYYASLVFGVSSWPMVFAWRISSYLMPLVVTWAAATVALRRYT